VSPTPSAAPTTSGQLVSTSGQLVFAGVTDRGENAPSIGEIYVVDADGGGLRQVTHQEQFAEYPAWSPDGTSIAYTSRVDERELGLWVVPANGGAPRQVVDQAARHPAWSATSDAIAFVSPAEAGGKLSIVNADGSGLHMVELPPGVADYPVWSPDGRHLTFTFFPQSGNRESVYIANAGGTDPRPLIEAGTYSYAASWSADSKRLAFVLDGQVAVAAVDGSDAEAITIGRAVDRPSFAPDGKRIVFTQNDGVWLMNADGTGVTALSVELDHAGFAAWRPTR
jgi:TolB protein